MLGFVYAVGILSLIVAITLARYIMKKPAGSAKMQEISRIIHHGALTFLRKEYEVLAIFMIVVFIVLSFIPENGFKIAVSFIIGAVLSALAGNIGMRISTKANARTAEATKNHIGDGLKCFTQAL
jgi:K(+)-stimulated pyrophosphate-energized sodium pump